MCFCRNTGFKGPDYVLRRTHRLQVLFEHTPEVLQLLRPSKKPVWVSVPEHFPIKIDQINRRPTLDSKIPMIPISSVPEDGMLQLPRQTGLLRFLKRGKLSTGHFDEGQALFCEFFFPPD